MLYLKIALTALGKRVTVMPREARFLAWTITMIRMIVLRLEDPGISKPLSDVSDHPDVTSNYLCFFQKHKCKVKKRRWRKKKERARK